MTRRLRHLAGRAAEESVERFYVARGARVIARRWTCREGEIDLIVEDRTGLVFVEVRARHAHGAAAQSLTARKLRKVHAAALTWMARHAVSPDSPMRFDAALVDGSGAVEILENITL